jgi:hypothetical protein
MDPLLTNGIDPSLLRVIEKRASEREGAPRRRRKPPAEDIDPDKRPQEGESNPEAPAHLLDDLA